MTTAERHTCEHKVWSLSNTFPCGVTAKFFERGRWYCGTHSPAEKVRRFQARDDARRQRMVPVYERQAAERAEFIAREAHAAMCVAALEGVPDLPPGAVAKLIMTLEGAQFAFGPNRSRCPFCGRTRIEGHIMPPEGGCAFGNVLALIPAEPVKEAHDAGP